METGARVTLDIVDLTEKGYGVAKAEGAVFFVRNGIPGDRVEAEIEEVRKRYFIANTVGLLQRSQDRIEPACRDCSLCGGCALSHASFELENRTKADTVRNAFKKAGIPLDFPEQAFALDRFGYRNKLTVHYSEELGAFGLYSEKTHSVFPFRECLLCPGIFSDCLRYINSIPEYFRDSCPDELIFQINGNGEVYITMKSRKRMNNRFRELVRARFPSVKEVLSSTPFRTEKSFFEDTILNFSLTYPTTGFRQVNTPVFENLLMKSAALLENSKTGCLVDLYCGSGTVGICLSAILPVDNLYGIELFDDSVSLAKTNAQKNGIRSSKYITGDASSVSKLTSDNRITDFTLIVDPPRSGLSDRSRAEILKCSPLSILYISCNPFTMSRDILHLTRHGYTATSGFVFNMFPSTEHVECVTMMTKK